MVKQPFGVVAVVGALMCGSLLMGCAADEQSIDAQAQTQPVASAGELVDGKDQFGHQLRVVDANNAPTASVQILPDAMEGWNLQISTDNWQWRPEANGEEAVANEGHGHLFVNGKKITRVYGDWLYLPKNMVSAGDEILISLNANDHSTWAVDGSAITAETVVPAADNTAAHNHSDDADSIDHDSKSHDSHG